MCSKGKSDNVCAYLLSQSGTIVVARFVGRGSICSFVLHYIYFSLISFGVNSRTMDNKLILLGAIQ